MLQALIGTILSRRIIFRTRHIANKRVLQDVLLLKFCETRGNLNNRFVPWKQYSQRFCLSPAEKSR